MVILSPSRQIINVRNVTQPRNVRYLARNAPPRTLEEKTEVHVRGMTLPLMRRCWAPRKHTPEFATSFFEKCCLSQCSRGSREKTAIICSNHILENLDPRLECSDASLRVYPLSSADAKSREDSPDVLAGRIQHLIVFSRLAEHLPFAQRL